MAKDRSSEDRGTASGSSGLVERARRHPAASLAVVGGVAAAGLFLWSKRGRGAAAEVEPAQGSMPLEGV